MHGSVGFDRLKEHWPIRVPLTGIAPRSSYTVEQRAKRTAIVASTSPSVRRAHSLTRARANLRDRDEVKERNFTEPLQLHTKVLQNGKMGVK